MINKIIVTNVIMATFFIGFNHALAWEITGTISGNAEAQSISGTVDSGTPAGGSAGGSGGGGTGGGTTPSPVGGGFGGYGGYATTYVPAIAQSNPIGGGEYLIPGPPSTGIGPLFDEKNVEGKTRFGKEEAIFTVVMASLIAMSAVRFVERYYYQRRIYENMKREI